MQTGYSLPGGDLPLTHARIAHANNWLTGGTVVASTTDADYFANGPLTTDTYARWKPTSLAATWEYDHGSSALCNYCVIGAHTMGTNGNTLQIQYWNGSGWTGLIPSTALTEDSPIMAIFGEQTRQRWRIQVSNGTVPEIGIVKFGYALQMPQRIYQGHAPVDFSRETVLRSNISDGGEFLGRSVQRRSLRSSFDWTHLKAQWIRDNWKSFQKAVEAEPFFIAWRPETFAEVALCWTDQPPIPTNSGPRDYMSVSVPVTGYAYD